MDPASRNRVLMIGGALIVIALLLVCGPLEGRFGGGQPGIDAVETTPDVAAAPPVLEAPAIDPTIDSEADARLGAAIGEADLANPIDALPVEALPIVPVPETVAPDPVPVRPPVKVAKTSPPKVARAEPPPVSAAGPEVAVPLVAVLPTADDGAARAADDFDSSLANMTNALDRDGGRVVDRFAPPVDSGPRVALAPQGFNAFALRPCDNPGAACQNVRPRPKARPTPAAGGSVIPSP